MKQRLFITGLVLWAGVLAGSVYALWSYADRLLSGVPLGGFEDAAVHRLNPLEAKRSFDRGAAVFVDVRSAFAYEAGHILGALHLPSHVSTAHLREVLASYPADIRVITYCSGGGCQSSRTLAKRLVEESVRDEVYVLTGGWPAWQAAGVGEEAGS